MIQGAFFSAFNFIANNKAAQIVLTAGLIVFAWMMNNRHQRGVGARNAESRIEKKSRKVQAKIQEESNETSKQVAAARDDIRAAPDLSSTELPDDEFEQLFGFRRDQREHSG